MPFFLGNVINERNINDLYKIYLLVENSKNIKYMRTHNTQTI